MPTRQVVLITVLAVGMLAMVVTVGVGSNSSSMDILAFGLLAAVFVVIAFVALRTRGQKSVDGYRGQPRWFWVLFASYAVAFALSMLLAVLAMPFVGFRCIELLFGPGGWVISLLLAAVVLPIVRRRLQ